MMCNPVGLVGSHDARSWSCRRRLALLEPEGSSGQTLDSPRSSLLLLPALPGTRQARRV